MVNTMQFVYYSLFYKCWQYVVKLFVHQVFAIVMNLPLNSNVINNFTKILNKYTKSKKY